MTCKFFSLSRSYLFAPHQSKQSKVLKMPNTTNCFFFFHLHYVHIVKFSVLLWISWTNLMISRNLKLNFLCFSKMRACACACVMVLARGFSILEETSIKREIMCVWMCVSEWERERRREREQQKKQKILNPILMPCHDLFSFLKRKTPVKKIRLKMNK